MMNKHLLNRSLISGAFLLSFFFLRAQPYLPNTKVDEFFRDYREAVMTEDRFVWGLTAGATVDLGFQKTGAFRFFVAGSVLKNFTGAFERKDRKLKFETLAGFQTEIEFFRGGLGTSLFKGERYKIHIEMRNSPQLTIAGGINRPVAGRPFGPSIGQSMSTLVNPADGSISIGTIFINGLNHRHNQRLGYLIAGYGNVQVYYANDGIPYHAWGLGDGFDRWWTGSGQIGYFKLNDFNFITEVAVRYDKFTGFQENLYELGNNLQIDNLQYKNIKIQYYNQARYQLRIGMQNMTRANFSWWKPEPIDFQDLIHQIRLYPYHNSLFLSRLSLGVESQIRYVKLQ